jgi:hypothetical protein
MPDPDLHELLDGSVGDVPPFDLGALARRRRRHRRRQVAALAGVVVALAAISSAFALNRPTGDHGVAVRTHGGPTTGAPNTTLALVSTTAVTGTTTSRAAATTTAAPANGPTTTTPTETAVPGQSAPQPGDFTGDITLSSDSIEAGDQHGVEVELHIHNATDHTINASYYLEPTTAGLMCTALDGQGRPIAPLTMDGNFAFVTNPPLGPGDDGGTGFSFRADTADIGTITCEGVIVTSSGGTITFVAPMTNIAPVTITVTTPTTTTTTTPADTTTTTTP